MAVSRKKFFDLVRMGPLPKRLTQSAVDTLNDILDEADERNQDDRWTAYEMATSLGEVGSRMAPVREGNGTTDAAARAYVKRKGYRYAKVVNGQVYYGRGLVQLTWDYNYKSMGTILGLDLYDMPDLALDPVYAVQIMFEGMTRGTFTGKKLSNYFNTKVTDPVNARRIINGTDRASEIAGYYKAFHSDIVGAQA